MIEAIIGTVAPVSASAVAVGPRTSWKFSSSRIAVLVPAVVEVTRKDLLQSNCDRRDEWKSLHRARKLDRRRQAI